MSTLIVGCGYLGTRVGRLLAARGERVFGTVRSPERAATIALAGIEPVIADVLAPRSLAALPGSADVFYCVGFDRTAGVAMRTVYVDGLRNVLERIGSRLKRLVYASTTGVYGRADGGWIEEDEPVVPLHEEGRVCLDAETLARGEGRPWSSATVILRFSGLYGPRRVPGRARLVAGDPIVGDPAKFLNLIHVDDAAEAAVAALERGEAGSCYHASDDRPVPREEYYRLAAALLGAPPPRFAPPSPDGPEALRERSNKRVSNRRLRRELGVTLAYPEITSGLPAALRDEERLGPD